MTIDQCYDQALNGSLEKDNKMIANTLIPIPFILDFSHFQFDQAIIFLVAVLLSITVNAEAQAFAATALGDIQRDAQDRFHFNPLFHLSLPGILCFIIAGFGWPRPIAVDRNRLHHQKFYYMMVRLAGPFANLILAGIAGSIVWIMAKWQMDDQVFSIVVSVNLMVFVFNIIPLPPLAGAAVLAFFFPDKIKISLAGKTFAKLSPYLVVGLFLSMKIKGITLFNHYMDPAVIWLFNFISHP